MVLIVWIANVLVLLAIAFNISRKEGELRPVFWIALFSKIVGGILFGLLYLYYYNGGDTLLYHGDAGTLAALARTNIQEYFRFLLSSGEAIDVSLQLSEPRAVFLSKLVSFFYLLTGGNYWLITGWFSVLSFYVSWLLVKELIRFDVNLKTAAFVSVLFFPSVVFWSSGLIKETVALAMIYFLVTVFLRLWKRGRVPTGWLILLPFALAALWKIKYYYAAVLLPVLLTEIVYSRFLQRRLANAGTALKLVCWFAVFLFPIGITMALHPNFNPSVLVNVIVDNHNMLKSLSVEESQIDYGALEPTATSLVINIPEAIVAGMFRPFIWETSGVLRVLYALENLVLLVLCACAFGKFIQGRQLSRGAFLILIYSVVLCVFLALSTPNFGTLSRYRVGFLPFLVLLCVDNCSFLKNRSANLLKRLVP